MTYQPDTDNGITLVDLSRNRQIQKDAIDLNVSDGELMKLFRESSTSGDYSACNSYYHEMTRRGLCT